MTVAMLTYPFTEKEANDANSEWGCNCGPYALSFALQRSLPEIHDAIPGFDGKRYTSPTMMRDALRKLGRECDVVIPSAETMFDERPALVRIQWTGPWTRSGANQKWAYRHTHWIATWTSDSANLVFDCNGGSTTFAGWTAVIIPAIVESIPRADGKWFPTHVWRV